jgi:DNA mismatch endonuclease (patch repair protein)
MALVRNKNTAVELRVRRLAHRMGLRFRLHDSKLPGRPDLVFRKYRLALFVHGCFWHRHPGCALARLPKSRLDFWEAKLNGNRARDLLHQEQLRNLGWRCAEIWECETLQETYLRLAIRRLVLEELDAIC